LVSASKTIMERFKQHLVYVRGKKFYISEIASCYTHLGRTQTSESRRSSKFEVDFGRLKSKRIEYLGVNFH
jgi:hypothetical protein